MKSKTWATTIGVLVLLAAGVGLLTGCESSDSSSDSSAKAPASGFGDNNPNLYVAFGDSITYGSGLTGPSYPDRLAGMLGKSVINLGMPGARSGQGVGALQGALSGYKPGYVLILFGANDIIMGDDPAGVAANVRSMAQIAKANNTVPIIATMNPMLKIYAFLNGGVRLANSMIRQVAADEGVALVDLEAEFGNNENLYIYDGVHPNDDGAQVMAMAFYERLN